MTRLLVLFNLKPGITPEEYERWARQVDLPTVRALESIEQFDVYRIPGLLESPAAAPYRYAEVIDIGDMKRFGAEIATVRMREIAARFSQLADAQFLATEPLDSETPA